MKKGASSLCIFYTNNVDFTHEWLDKSVCGALNAVWRRTLTMAPPSGITVLQLL